MAAGLLASIAGWAATAELAGAVIAKGIMVVDLDVKKIQHPTGGIVGELRVHDDQHVNEGDIIVRLDGTQTKANLDVYAKGLDELFARRARLEAEKEALNRSNSLTTCWRGNRPIVRLPTFSQGNESSSASAGGHARARRPS